MINNISSGAASLDPTNHPHPPNVSTMNDPVYTEPSNPPYQQPQQYQQPPPNYQQMYYQNQQKLYQEQQVLQEQQQQYQVQMQAQQAQYQAQLQAAQQAQYQVQLQAQQEQYQQQYWQQNPRGTGRFDRGCRPGGHSMSPLMKYKLHLCRKSLVDYDPHRVDQQLGADTQPHPLHMAHPPGSGERPPVE